MPKKHKETKEVIFTPSKYQSAILDFVKNGHGNCVVEASAGSGKTFTAIKCIEQMGQNDKILLTAFNTDIVEELKNKIKTLPNKNNIDCRTIHSLGYMILMSNYHKKIEPSPNEFKYSGYIYNNIGTLSEGFYFGLNYKDGLKYVDNIKRFVDFGRFYLCESIKDFEFIEKHYNIPVFDNEKEVAMKVMQWGKEHIETIDFTDMIWLPNVLDCKPYCRIYDWIICDECQDMMTAERMLLLRCTSMSTRMLFFGEKIQCQPEGTMILMSDGSQKDIKDVRIGDKVVSYNIKKSTYSGYKANQPEHDYTVSGIESHVSNKFIRINTENGMSSMYTPEHICLAKFNFGKHSKVWGIALMENDSGMFFIGKALLYSNKIHHGLLKTLKSEFCTRGWVLNVCFDETEAKLEQIRISQVYNIPLQPSEIFGKKNDDMARNLLWGLYEKMGHNKIMENALKCLEDHQKMPQFPISDAYNQIPHARTCLHTVRACNLIPELMEVSYFDIAQKSKKIKDSYRYAASMIKEIEYIRDEKMVYSLNVDKSHTYVADGIATHNCIYSFMGSDYRSFDELRKLPNTISLPLSISYRCSNNVVKYVRKFNERIEARADAPDGKITFNAQIQDIQDGDMVLCRVNAPLLTLYCELVKMGKPVYIRGKDIGSNLVRIVKRTKEKKLNRRLNSKGVFSHLYDKLFDEIDTVMKKHHVTFGMALDDSWVSQMYDTIQALYAISEDLKTSDELIEKIKSMFSDGDMKGIRLSTIHKAKGLESDNVFICCPSLMPAKSATEDWELQEERNLEYVAYTRAKNNLSFLDEKEFKKYAADTQEKESDLLNIKAKIFSLYGNYDRCQPERPSYEVAKHIIKNSTKIIEGPSKAIDLNNKKNNKPISQFVLTKRKRRPKR